MNLLFAIDERCIDQLSMTLRSILRCDENAHYEVYILESDLKQETKKAISNISESLSFHFIQVDKDIFKGFMTTSRYPETIYYRLIAPLVLPEDVDRILYLDVDIIVINKLDELYNMDFEGNYYIACSHVNEILTKVNQLRLNVKDVPYINTGVMLMDINKLRHIITIESIKETANNKMKILMLPDQDLLTVIHGEHIKTVDPFKFNMSERVLQTNNADFRKEKIDIDWIRRNTLIIHYCGRNKPWKKGYIGELGIFYKEFCRL